LKKIEHIVILLLLLSCFQQKAQTVFWTETFNTGCASGCLANGVNTGNGAWSTTALAGDANPLLGDFPNDWYVSCAENGHTNTICGSGCVALSAINTKESLHIGSTSIGDIGAAYDAGGLCGIFYCVNTHKRVESPNISTIGLSGISIAFDYIEFGNGTLDDFYALQYSTNGGVSWTTISNPPKTLCCGGTCNGSLQGKWTTYTTPTLPVAADNILNLRIAFVWKNNDDGIGSDPSIAIDNITISNLVVLPIELTYFNSEENNNTTEISWKTISENNSDYFELQLSNDGITFNKLAKIKAAGNSHSQKSYTFKYDKKIVGQTYFRLKMVDLDNSYKYSHIIFSQFSSIETSNINTYLDDSKNIIITKNYISNNNLETLCIINTEGKVLKKYNLRELITENDNEKKIILNQNDLDQGIYFIQLIGLTDQISFKILIQ
jgi:hypothetical protein